MPGMLDVLAGLLGAIIAATHHEKATAQHITAAMLTGVLAAYYGAPVLAEWQHLSKSAEYLCAAIIGLTAHTHIIPAVLETASELKKLPAKVIEKRFK